MAKEITSQERREFAIHKSLAAAKWIIVSGTATYFLTGLTEIVAEISLPKWATLASYLFINVAIYAIAKYIEGENNK
jgi:hypothetical protein